MLWPHSRSLAIVGWRCLGPSPLGGRRPLRESQPHNPPQHRVQHPGALLVALLLRCRGMSGAAIDRVEEVELGADSRRIWGAR